MQGLPSHLWNQEILACSWKATLISGRMPHAAHRRTDRTPTRRPVTSAIPWAWVSTTRSSETRRGVWDLLVGFPCTVEWALNSTAAELHVWVWGPPQNACKNAVESIERFQLLVWKKFIEWMNELSSWVQSGTVVGTTQACTHHPRYSWIVLHHKGEAPQIFDVYSCLFHIREAAKKKERRTCVSNAHN